MKPTVTRASLVTALVAPVLLLGPSADAAGTKGKDPKGDAPRAVDFTAWKASNAKKKLTFTMKYPALKVSKVEMFGVAARPKGKGAQTYVAVWLRDGADLKPAFTNPKGELVACKGMKLVTGKDKVVLKVPQKCYGKKAKAPKSFSGATFHKNGEYDETPFSKVVKFG